MPLVMLECPLLLPWPRVGHIIPYRVTENRLTLLLLDDAVEALVIGFRHVEVELIMFHSPSGLPIIVVVEFHLLYPWLCRSWPCF